MNDSKDFLANLPDSVWSPLPVTGWFPRDVLPTQSGVYRTRTSGPHYWEYYRYFDAEAKLWHIGAATPPQAAAGKVYPIRAARYEWCGLDQPHVLVAGKPVPLAVALSKSAPRTARYTPNTGNITEVKRAVSPPQCPFGKRVVNLTTKGDGSACVLKRYTEGQRVTEVVELLPGRDKQFRRTALLETISNLRRDYNPWAYGTTVVVDTALIYVQTRRDTAD